MNIESFQNHLSQQWQKLISQTAFDKDYDKSGGITHAHDIFSFITNSKKHLGLEINISDNQEVSKDLIPKAKNWKINILHKKIVMELYNEDYKEIFISTINKIICKIFLENKTGNDAIKSFLEHLHNHKDFFESEGGPKILSIEAQIGLFGEVFFLNNILSNKINIIEANNYWTGPYKKYDFTTLKIFLETKTSTSKSNKIINTSMNQINPNQERPLFLVFLNLNESNNGINLNDLINDFRNKLDKSSLESLNDFNLKLLKVGYHESHSENYTKNYEVKLIKYFFISKDFPHVKDISKPDAIEDLKVNYKINLDKCNNFLINENDFLNKI